MANQSKHRMQQVFECPVCGQKKVALEILSGHGVRPALIEDIRKMAPHWTFEQNICLDCLNHARSAFVEQSLIRAKGVLSVAERDVVNAIKNHELISMEGLANDSSPTFGERAADRIASVGGSWGFILVFCLVICGWIALNSLPDVYPFFDPYPYILLNLALSCLAALQAPIIMMCQNRQEAKDSARAEADYKTNLKAELEIRHLHMKLDQLSTHQWHRLLEIQQIQLDMLNDAQKPLEP